MSPVPKAKEFRGAPRISRIHHDMKMLAVELRKEGREHEALQCENAGAQVDRTAKALGYEGAKIKTMVCYSVAVQLYRHVTGKPYGMPA